MRATDQYEPIGGVEEPEPREGYDPNFAMVVRYHPGDTRFTRRLRPTASGPLTVSGEVEYMCCNDRTCLPPTVVSFQLEVDAE
jgi:thiol:disulfide interchange protein DsbD